MNAHTTKKLLLQIKITEFEINWDWNPWDMPPDYDLEDEMMDKVFEVEYDPSLTEDENRQCISDQIHEQEGFMWQVKEIDWVETSVQ